MSTTYLIVVNDVDVEVARTHFNGTKTEVTWLNPLADLLVDEELVMSDSGAPLCLTVGDLRELQVPSDSEVILKLRLELEQLRADLEIEVLKRKIEMENSKNLSNALQESLDREAVHRKEIRVLKRELLTAKDVKLDTENYEVTLFGEERDDGRGGFFEHKEYGEDSGGGLWFGYDFGNNKYLRDYDGLHYLPKEVVTVLEQEGIETASDLYRETRDE